tara:strand:- start:736 stop:870 length:135 start_codon:yes stop_codon:yes gene_type:complete
MNDSDVGYPDMEWVYVEMKICKKCGNVFYTKTPTVCPQCKEPLT